MADKLNQKKIRNIPLNTIVTFESPVRIEPAEVVATLRRLSPSAFSKVSVMGNSSDEQSRLSIDGVEIEIEHRDSFAPSDAFVHASSPNLFWPDAKQQLSRHKAYACLAIPKSDFASRDDLLTASRALTWLTAAVVSINPTIGVYWPASHNLVSHKFFMDGLRNSLVEARNPLELWVKLYAGRSEHHGRFLAVTRGLKPYAGRDVEYVSSSLAGLAMRALQVAGYLVDGGIEFRDGDTIGAPEDRRYRVELKDQGVFKDGPVYRIEASVAS